jgi:hypothetical protein
MANATLASIKTAIGLGARPNLFRIYFGGGLNDASVLKDGTVSLLCKAGSLPGSTMGVIEVPMGGGRRYKLSGDRTYAEWTVTILNDSAGNARKVMEDYQKLFVKTDMEELTLGDRVGTTRTTVTVEQLTEDATTIGRKYKLINCFPTDISAMDLSYDTTDTLQEFTVTWVYDYFEATAT